MKVKVRLSTGLLALLPVLALAGGSWWNGDWKFRKEIGLDLSPTGADVAGTAQDVPVLVRLSLANFNYFNDTKPDGSDFRVIDGDDKTALKFHFERYDQANQMAFLWVHGVKLTGGAKTDKFYAYYGNPSAPAGGPDAPGTYDVSQALVLHFGEASGPPQDATAYKNNATASSAEPVPASLIAGGLKFSGGQIVTVPASPSLRLLPAQGFTTTAWVKVDAAQARATVAALADGAKELTLGIDGMKAFATYSGGAAPVSVTGPDLAAGQWHHLALTLGANALTLYVDGAPAGSAPATMAEIGGSFTVGGAARGGGFLTAEVDEVGASKVARSADRMRRSSSTAPTARRKAAAGPPTSARSSRT
jgi:biopolymer transport protein ExbB